MKLPLINQNTVINPDVDDPAQDQLTTWYTEHAVSFIHQHKDQPFFLYVPHAMVHVPLHVSDKFRGKTRRGLFGDVVEELDWSVGQILSALKQDGLDERTLVMFCSDNGPWLCFGDHAGSAYPLREGKGTSWDGGVREPTLMRWPGHIPAGRVCDAPLMTIDMLPTIARLIGANLPPNKLDGLDISEVITGKTDQSPHDVLYFYYHDNDLEALRGGKWKLELARSYRSLNGKPGGKNGRPVPYVDLQIAQPELFDLDADPGQQHNVAAKQPDVVKKLLAAADRMRAELGDRLTKQSGTQRRAPGRVTVQDVFPSDVDFPKAFDPKYQPKAPGPKEQSTSSRSSGGYKNLSLDEFAQMAADKANVVLDVRTPSEFASGHLAGALNLDVNASGFEEKAAALDKSKIYLVHCAAGVRSAQACRTLDRLGFSNVYNLPSGFRAWAKAAKPIEK